MTLEELYFALKDLYEAGEGDVEVYVSDPMLAYNALVQDVDVDCDGYIVVYTH